MKKLILTIIILVLGAVVLFTYWNRTAFAPTESLEVSNTIPPKINTSIYDPSRITKKFFGTYVTPANSPVQPEKFTGYHTGVDFETTATEANLDIPVPVFCDGKLSMKKSATGYGGVAVQSCMLDGQAVTIIYGHLKLTSIMATVGQQLKKGDKLGILGKGYSAETSGERKHLHFGIHKGTAVNILGYVQNRADLSGWLDPIIFVK